MSRGWRCTSFGRPASRLLLRLRPVLHGPHGARSSLGRARHLDVLKGRCTKPPMTGWATGWAPPLLRGRNRDYVSRQLDSVDLRTLIGLRDDPVRSPRSISRYPDFDIVGARATLASSEVATGNKHGFDVGAVRQDSDWTRTRTFRAIGYPVDESSLFPTTWSGQGSRIPLRLRLRHGEGWSRSLALPFALNPWTTTDSTRTPHPARRAERCPSGSPHTTRKRAETTTAGPRERADGHRSIRRPGIRQK